MSEEVTVDEKDRIVVPRPLREKLGIEPGTVLEVEYKHGGILVKPKVPFRQPTEALWGMAKTLVEENPKKTARKAIASRLQR